MLERENRLNVSGLGDFLESIVKEFVEEPERLVVTYDEFDRKVLFHLSVDKNDLPTLETPQFTYRSLKHIMNRVTQANVGKPGDLDDEFGITPINEGGE